ncbi:MAG: prephenate dehydrogenase/arogenate dehydrogenase family protein [Candidatus Omnitrophota bacterium]|nr:prephenate dehydrogenase/arogenate dehydrogenase family protein [Candidatus Omnitrophota bacterium]
MKIFNRVAIIGVGLIGGSIGLAIKKKKLAGEVIGVARKNKTLKDALRLKAIDWATHNIVDAVKDADLVILCQPVKAIIASFTKISKFLKPGAIVTDVGSSKQEIVSRAEDFLKDNIYFVGVHPLAGSEKKGVNFANSELFLKSMCILTPTMQTNKTALKKIKKFWRSLGAKTFVLKPDVHDRIIAFISHLPHILIFSLINSIPASYLRFSSTGLKDATRIASSDAVVWKDICLSNSKEILKAIETFEATLRNLKRQILKKDAHGLKRKFINAQKKRKILEGRLS